MAVGQTPPKVLISNREFGTREPDVFAIIGLCDFFGVSADFFKTNRILNSRNFNQSLI